MAVWSLASLIPLGACSGGNARSTDSVDDVSVDGAYAFNAPILEHTPAVIPPCTVEHQAIPLDVGSDVGLGTDLVSYSKTATLVLGQMHSNWVDLSVMAVGPSGAIGEAHVLPPMITHGMLYPQAVASSDGIAIVYTRRDATTFLEFVAVDRDGSVVEGPARIGGTEGFCFSAIAATENGYALIGAAEEGGDLRFLRLGPGGSAVGTAVDLPSLGLYMGWPPPRLLPVADGFVASWTDGREHFQSLAVARLGSDGHVLGDVLRIAPSDRNAEDPVVVAVDGGYLLAWTEGREAAASDIPGWKIVLVQRLNTDLMPIGDPRPLQAPTDEVACHSPRWATLDGGPALAWACGYLPSACAGCESTEKIGFVPLHPSDLTPAAGPIAVKSTIGGGLLNPILVRLGDTWLVYADITFHANSVPSLSALRCE